MYRKQGSVGLVAMLILALWMVGAAAAQDTPIGTVNGTVTYVERIALSEGAEVVVELADVSRADAPARVIASQVILARGRQVPFGFALNYDTVSISEGGTYAVSARIFEDGALRWINDTRYEVITNSVFTVDLTLVQVEAPDETTEAGDMSAAFGTVTGTVSYMQRIALPPEAVVLVELADVSRADAPAFVLASQQFKANDRQVPFAFSLDYDATNIAERGTYSVSAKIFVDGALAWISDTVSPVITNGVSAVDVRVVQVTD